MNSRLPKDDSPPQLLAGASTGALLAISLDSLFALLERHLGSDTLQDQSVVTG
jgi:osmoprotectant transport system permease protein